jgi:hypothetical protein
LGQLLLHLLPDCFEVRQAEGGEQLRAKVLGMRLENLDHLEKKIFSKIWTPCDFQKPPKVNNAPTLVALELIEKFSFGRKVCR